jgi:hypothetical protein
MPERRNLLRFQYPEVFLKLQHRLNEQELDITALTMTIQPADREDFACMVGVRPAQESADSFRATFGEMTFDLPTDEAVRPGPKVSHFSEELIARYKEALAAVPR